MRPRQPQARPTERGRRPRSVRRTRARCVPCRHRRCGYQSRAAARARARSRRRGSGRSLRRRRTRAIRGRPRSRSPSPRRATRPSRCGRRSRRRPRAVAHAAIRRSGGFAPIRCCFVRVLASRRRRIAQPTGSRQSSVLPTTEIAQDAPTTIASLMSDPVFGLPDTTRFKEGPYHVSFHPDYIADPVDWIHAQLRHARGRNRVRIQRPARQSSACRVGQRLWEAERRQRLRRLRESEPPAPVHDRCFTGPGVRALGTEPPTS